MSLTPSLIKILIIPNQLLLTPSHHVAVIEKAFAFDLEPSDTIVSVKMLLQDWVEILPMDQCLWFAGKPLEVVQTLSDYDVLDGSTMLVKNFDDP